MSTQRPFEAKTQLTLAIFSSLFCLALQLTSSSSAEASETPYARTCRMAGGEAWTVNFSESQDLTLCRFGSAAIGAAEFATFKWDGTKASSIRAFQNAAPTNGGDETCRINHASSAKAMDSEQVQWDLCVFSDGSAIEVNTLARSSSSPYNLRLAEALR